jgi:hypothetical protein
MVPDSLFSKYSLEHYLLSTSKPSIDFFIQSEYIEPLQQHCVYESPKFLAEVLSEFQVQQRHWTHGFLLNLLTAGSAEARVYAIFNDRTLTVAVTSGHNLLFLNEFQYISATDALYYVLLAYQESGLEPLANELVLLGEINTNGEIYNYLRTYISKIQVVRDGTLPEEANYYNYLFTNQFI